MCGRYEFKILHSSIGKQIKDKADELSLQYKQGEIFPNDYVLVIVPIEDKITMKSMKWGIILNNFIINARLDKINTSSFYRQMKDNRCAVIANGFYEWDKDKNKYYISTSDEYIYLACIYNSKQELLIITTDAEAKMKDIHHRMPIIMNKDEMLNYLFKGTLKVSDKELIISNRNNELKLL